jgi:uncharacterized lipoprotein YehR (DUF1307 family)
VTRLMKGTLLAFALIVALAAPAAAHEQKFMGTVSSIDGVHVQLTTTDKKDVMVMLHDKTKILRGKETQKAEDIKVGDRIVVVTTDGKDKSGKSMLMAKEVRLGTAGTTKK